MASLDPLKVRHALLGAYLTSSSSKEVFHIAVTVKGILVVVICIDQRHMANLEDGCKHSGLHCKHSVHLRRRKSTMGESVHHTRFRHSCLRWVHRSECIATCSICGNGDDSTVGDQGHKMSAFGRACGMSNGPLEMNT
jgi:hypothetical protein